MKIDSLQMRLSILEHFHLGHLFPKILSYRLTKTF